MASNTMATWHKRTQRKRNAGRKRKNGDARHSTDSFAELFAGMGEPGKPLQAGQPGQSAKAKPAKSASK